MIKCPQHGYSKWLQIQLFYHGLTSATKSILDASVGGSIFGKTNQEAHTLLEDLANISYNWPSDRALPPTAVGLYELDEVTSLKARLSSLTNVLDKLTTGGQAQRNLPSIVAEIKTANFVRKNQRYQAHPRQN